MSSFAERLNISIHALRGEGDGKKPKERIMKNISIHALRGEGDVSNMIIYAP